MAIGGALTTRLCQATLAHTPLPQLHGENPIEVCRSMIIDVPTAESLFKTGAGWLNLAWQIAADALREKRDIDDQLDELGDTFEQHERDAYIEAFWRSKIFFLNNSFSLTHQSLEILLKARIAKVSPFLLIANDERSWPKLKGGNISFYDFKTIGADNIYKIVNAVEDKKLTTKAIDLFEKIRKERNIIIHLDNDRFPVEIKALISNIQRLFRHLIDGVSWRDFRLPVISQNQNPGDVDIWGIDFSYDSFVYETNLVIDFLSPAEGMEFFGINKRRKRSECDNCKYNCSKHFDGEAKFVQIGTDQNPRCAICGTVYDRKDFPELISRNRSNRLSVRGT